MDKANFSPLKSLTPSRLLAFCDGVFSIAATLLVLGIDIPEGEHIRDGNLNAFFLSLEPFIIAFITSFLLICIYWMQHHLIFKFVKQINSKLIWLNILLLLVVSLLPFISKLKSLYRLDIEVIIIFAAAHFLCGMIMFFIWRYVVNHRELHANELNPASIKWASRRILFTPFICILAVATAFLNPWISNYVLLLIPFYMMLSTLTRKRVVSE
jgi:uncharacterized membrane protein